MTLPPLTDETIALLTVASTATISTQLVKRGLSRVFMVGPQALRPQDKLVGEAYTLRYIPSREDRNPGVTYDNAVNIQRLAIEEVGPGQVLVIDARGDIGAGTLGDILATRLMARGAAGIVTDGAFRDAARIAEVPMPSYCAGTNGLLSSVVHFPADRQVPIGCGNVMVLPGDVIVGDEDGVLVVPRALADEVAAAAAEQELLEEFVVQKIRAGSPIAGTYPPDEATQAEFAAWRAGQ